MLGGYIEPGPRDAVSTLDRLLTILDNRDLTLALDRVRRRQTIRLVE